MHIRAFILVILPMLPMSSCMDQYNPRPYWSQFTKEREITSAPTRALTEKGELPAKADAVASQDPVSAKYATLCASCHGADGKADGAASAAMNPKPRNFHDRTWQAQVDDARITMAIKSGGTSVGLSGTMPPWGAVLSDEEVAGMVAKIRAWGQ